MLSRIQQRQRRCRRLVMVLLFTLLCSACTDLSAPPPVPKRSPIPSAIVKTAQPTRVAAPSKDQTWLVLLYEDADDEILEEDMFNDLNEAEVTGSSDRVRIVAQMDRYDGAFEGDGDWK